MRILYDGQVYAGQPTGGINRYFNNLISRLPESFSPYLTIATKYQAREIIYPSHANLKTFKYGRFGFKPGRLSYWMEKYYFRFVTGLYDFNVFHPSYYSLLTRQDVSKHKIPVVITVWDMIHEIFPDQLDPNGGLRNEKQKAIEAAQAIICISENTKKDLIERYSLPEDKISVTYLAADINASISYGLEPVPSRPYYLYVGYRTSYKNFDGLLLAFEKVVSVQPDILLCVVGPPINQAEAKLIDELKLGNHVVHYKFATDTHLAKLYRCSVALVYPSKYEGFGIPPLEAMSCQTAVVASNCSSIPEVVGDAGLLFDSNSPSELADILLFLLDHPTKRDGLIAKGTQRAKAFTWEKTVAQTLDVYRCISVK